MSTTPVVDVVIPVHDSSRPIQRAVASVLEGSVPGSVRVTVVCHGLREEDVRLALGDTAGADVRLLEFEDGIRSAAGPFNHGVAAATAEYVSVMGSDDFLEPDAMRLWIDYVTAEGPDAALVRLRYQGAEKLHSPLTRVGRSRRLDPVKDRIFYRTAPLGLVRTSAVASMGLRFSEGFRTGDDLEFSARLWTEGGRIDYLRDLPCYVIGSDAETRVTTQPMPAEDFLRAVDELARSPWVSGLPRAVKRSLAIKLTRIHLLGALTRRPAVDAWRGDDEVRYVRDVLAAIADLSPGFTGPFSRADRRLLDALTAPEVSVDSVVAAVAAFGSSGRVHQILPRNPLRLLDRESTLTRYALYALTR